MWGPGPASIPSWDWERSAGSVPLAAVGEAWVNSEPSGTQQPLLPAPRRSWTSSPPCRACRCRWPPATRSMTTSSSAASPWVSGRLHMLLLSLRLPWTARVLPAKSCRTCGSVLLCPASIYSGPACPEPARRPAAVAGEQPGSRGRARGRLAPSVDIQR